nr:MAG TPA: hypothetical protein [Caudoviricetes sp.]
MDFVSFSFFFKSFFYSFSIYFYHIHFYHSLNLFFRCDKIILDLGAF